MKTQIWFYESDLEEVLEMFPAKTKGKDIKPKNKYKSKIVRDNRKDENSIGTE